ncbi:hypothetical protein OROHE_026302 [Orobanche hederae]
MNSSLGFAVTRIHAIFPQLLGDLRSPAASVSLPLLSTGRVSVKAMAAPPHSPPPPPPPFWLTKGKKAMIDVYDGTRALFSRSLHSRQGRILSDCSRRWSANVENWMLSLLICNPFNDPQDMDTYGMAIMGFAAKNFKDVLVVVDPGNYPAVMEYLQANQESQSFRRMLMGKAFAYYRAYPIRASELLSEQTPKVIPSMSEKTPQELELDDVHFAWLCVKHATSGAIVIAKDSCMLGIGFGQPNHLESLGIALEKAGENVKGAVLATNSFATSDWKEVIEEACIAGVRAIVVPGGDIVAFVTCKKYGVALHFADVSH